MNHWTLLSIFILTIILGVSQARIPFHFFSNNLGGEQTYFSHTNNEEVSHGRKGIPLRAEVQKNKPVDNKVVNLFFNFLHTVRKPWPMAIFRTLKRSHLFSCAHDFNKKPIL